MGGVCGKLSVEALALVRCVPCGSQLYEWCYGKHRVVAPAHVSWYSQVLCVSLGL
jgi:hypothetical protein